VEEWHADYYGTEANPYGSLLERLSGGDEEDSEPVATDLAGLIALRQQAQLGRVLGELGWLGQARGAQALCLDCPLPMAATPPQVKAGWIGNLAAVLGMR
jgi:protease-4